jgi:c-di-GMP-binding flagellar brake protein YcgR
MQTDTIESHGSYALRGRGDIIEKLRLMQKNRALLTAHPKGFGPGFVTTVVNVMPEKGLVVVDVSEDPSTNRQFLAAEHITFTTQVGGIHTHFTLTSLAEATLQGHPVFAAPLPESLYWFERRKFYRVPIPVSLPAKCSVVMENNEVADFSLLDLSITGVALHDKQRLMNDSVAPGHIFARCSLVLPDMDAIRMGLEVRYKVDVAGSALSAGQRVGCLFHSLSRQSEINLQKFIYEVELEKKRRDDLLKRTENP